VANLSACLIMLAALLAYGFGQLGAAAWFFGLGIGLPLAGSLGRGLVFLLKLVIVGWIVESFRNRRRNYY
jgi:hypothetical protein